MNSYETEETAEITAKRSALTSVFFSVDVYSMSLSRDLTDRRANLMA